MALVVKNPLANAGDVRDTSSIPGSGRSPGEWHGNPLQCSCLETRKNRGTGIGLQRVRHDSVTYANTHTNRLLILLASPCTAHLVSVGSSSSGHFCSSSSGFSPFSHCFSSTPPAFGSWTPEFIHQVYN